MTSVNFCYWLQGYFEIMLDKDNIHGLNASQVDVIKKHLTLVFKCEINPPLVNETYLKIHGESPISC